MMMIDVGRAIVEKASTKVVIDANHACIRMNESMMMIDASRAVVERIAST